MVPGIPKHHCGRIPREEWNDSCTHLRQELIITSGRQSIFGAVVRGNGFTSVLRRRLMSFMMELPAPPRSSFFSRHPELLSLTVAIEARVPVCHLPTWAD